MKYDSENALRQDLEKQLEIGAATVKDAILFCEINKPSYWGPMELDRGFLRERKHEAGIVFSTRASLGVFRLSNWKNLLRYFYQLRWYLFISAEWRIFFYFDKDFLTEIEVLRFEHWP